MSIILEGIDLPNSGEIELIIRPHGKVLSKTRGIYAEAIQIPRRTLSVVNRKREWIPTSLCLPKEGRPVLVSVKTKARLPKWVEKPTYYYVTDIDVYDDYGWRDNGKNVVAWQPLPEPYKGE